MFAVPAEKGKLEKMSKGHLRDATKEHKKISFRKFSSCDKGVRKDVRQDIFELTPATVALRKRPADHFLVFLCHISKIVLWTI